MASKEVIFEMEYMDEVEDPKNKNEKTVSFADSDETELTFNHGQTRNKRRSHKEFQEKCDLQTKDLCRRLCLQRPEDQKTFHQKLCSALLVVQHENSNNEDESVRENANKTVVLSEENNVNVTENDEAVIDYQDETVDVHSPKFMWFICRIGFIISFNIAVIIFVIFVIFFGYFF